MVGLHTPGGAISHSSPVGARAVCRLLVHAARAGRLL